MSSIVVKATVYNVPEKTSLLVQTSALRDDSFTLEVTEPTALNSGLNVEGVPTSELTIINGDLIVNSTWVAANGTSHDRLWIKGHLVVTSNVDVEFTNCFITGRTFTGAAPYSAIVYADSSNFAGHVDLINCRVTCVQPNVGIVTIMGKKIRTLERCHIDLGSDGADFWAQATVDVRGCFFGPMSFWNNDPKHTNDSQHPGWNHPDQIQISGGDGQIIGNAFDIRMAAGVGSVDDPAFMSWSPTRAYGCGVMMTPGDGHINMVIRSNWYRYGEVHIAMPNQNRPTDNNNSMIVTQNRHDLGMHPYGPYGNPPKGSYQAIRWSMLEGPLPADVHDNIWLGDANVPSALRGQNLPDAVAQGSGATGQYIVSYNM